MLTCGLETFQLPTRFNAGPEDADAKRSPEEEGQGEDYVISTAVYGTKDGPRGWYKNLHTAVVKVGLRPVPHEQAAFVLNDETGVIAGLAIVHIDDILWTGGRVMEEKMQEVIELYKVGKVEKNDFKYCGRQILKDSKGAHVTCPSFTDRVQPIYMGTAERKNKQCAATDGYKLQLRSVIGSLAWLARVCRPDLAYPVNYLQARVGLWRCGICKQGDRHRSCLQRMLDCTTRSRLSTLTRRRPLVSKMQVLQMMLR